MTTATYDEVQAMWDTTEAGGRKDTGGKSTYTPVPDGEHTAVAKKVGVKEEEGKSPAVFIEFYFPAVNTTETAYWNVVPVEGAVKAIKGLFNSLFGTKDNPDSGVPQSSHPSELRKAITKAEGWTLKVKKATKPNPKGGKDFRNFFVNAVLSRTTSAPADKGDDSIPF